MHSLVYCLLAVLVILSTKHVHVASAITNEEHVNEGQKKNSKLVAYM